jgi:glucokinase
VTTLRGDSEGTDDTILGIDIGGTKTSLLAAARATGRVVARSHIETPRGAEPSALVELLGRESRSMLERAGADPEAVRAVGCAVPGLVDPVGRVIGAGNLTGWNDVPLWALLEHEWYAPAFVEQDANAGAIGEMWLGVAKAMNDFVFLALGTGVGAGIVLRRRIHRGAHQAAGELGDLLLGPPIGGRRVRNAGNLAARVGSRALRMRAREATRREVRAVEAASGATGDSRLESVARDIAGELAVAVIAIGALLDPEAIVFGGGTAAAGERLLARVRDCTKGALPVDPVLVLASLGEDAQVYGAIAGALGRIDPDFVRAADWGAAQSS